MDKPRRLVLYGCRLSRPGIEPTEWYPVATWHKRRPDAFSEGASYVNRAQRQARACGCTCGNPTRFKVERCVFIEVTK